MTWSPQNGSLGLHNLRQRYHEGTLRRIDLIETWCVQIARWAVLHLQALSALAGTLQDSPRVAGSAA